MLQYNGGSLICRHQAFSSPPSGPKTTPTSRPFLQPSCGCWPPRFANPGDDLDCGAQLWIELAGSISWHKHVVGEPSAAAKDVYRLSNHFQRPLLDMTVPNGAICSHRHARRQSSRVWILKELKPLTYSSVEDHMLPPQKVCMLEVDQRDSADITHYTDCDTVVLCMLVRYLKDTCQQEYVRAATKIQEGKEKQITRLRHDTTTGEVLTKRLKKKRYSRYRANNLKRHVSICSSAFRLPERGHAK
ncbi:hypothetical protein BR93DRAFT_770220 [Coniochaeta sp. PMI_546]|nr:hypothetical protein BR93DRAFT_770220 [Coniochaeta sp. PMI_546]